MGDRANIKTADGIFFYTHWAGTELPDTLADALDKGRDRWDDSLYLNRVIFCEMVGEDKGITGYGISTACGDGDNRILELTDDGVKGNSQSWTFEEFIALRPSWEQILS